MTAATMVTSRTPVRMTTAIERRPLSTPRGLRLTCPPEAGPGNRLELGLRKGGSMKIIKPVFPYLELKNLCLVWEAEHAVHMA